MLEARKTVLILPFFLFSIYISDMANRIRPSNSTNFEDFFSRIGDIEALVSNT